MAGPIIGGSPANENINNRVKSAVVQFTLTNTAGGAFSTCVSIAPTGQTGDVKFNLSGTAGTLLTADGTTTFGSTAGASAAKAGILNIELRDDTATKFLFAYGTVHTASITAANAPGLVHAAASNGGVVAKGTAATSVGGVYFSLFFAAATNTAAADVYTCSVVVHWQ